MKRLSIVTAVLAVVLMVAENARCQEHGGGDDAAATALAPEVVKQLNAAPGGPAGPPPGALSAEMAQQNGKGKTSEENGGPKEQSDKKDGAQKSEGDAEETDTDVTRPTEPDEPPDPTELEVRPDADGNVRFQFRNQPWLGVLEWLAEISTMSLDWQEIPGGYLNLTTTESYSVDKTRDLINRHLLARGYTLLRNGEILSVVKLEKLNPGMVPRVEPEALSGRDPHEFVKVSFALDWLPAATMVEELGPMLSPHGKVTPLAQTNRIEAIDAVVNLREIHALLTEELATAGQGRLVREFSLVHTRAENVREHLLSLLGVKSQPTPMTPQQMQAAQQQAMMMAQQHGRPGGDTNKSGPPATPPTGDVQIVADSRRNCLLVSAPPQKMKIVEQAIKILDVASGSSATAMAEITRMQIYRLATIDPEPLVETLEDLGGLDPSTRLQIDDENRAIIAYATLADHVTIRALIDKLDGSARQFEVIPLRRLEADYVAGTIAFLMGGQEDENKSSSPSRSYFFSPFSDSSPKKSSREQDDFRVDADVEHNRLLLWANDLEIEEVNSLLLKLGEIPPEGGDPRTYRVLEPMPVEDARRLMESLREAWPGVAPNPLVLPARPSPETDELRATPDAPPSEDEGERPKNPGAKSPPDPVAPYETAAVTRLASLSQIPNDVSSTHPEGPPPVRLSQDIDGNLIIASDDPRALDLLEKLIAQLAPRPTDYKIYRLKYAWAYSVRLTLEDLFDEDDDEDDNRRSRYWYYWDEPKDSDTPSRSRLSQRRPLKFISDSDTNSLLVQNATPAQLAKIEEIIEFYDQPEPTDSQSVRQTEVVKLRYSKAEIVAEAVKDVYRDLLSSNDKSLADGTGQGRSERVYFYDSYGEDEGAEKKMPKFKGLLSIGIDKHSNTLIVSAPGFLIEDVLAMITALDDAARPRVEVVQVVPLRGGLSAGSLQKVLGEVLGEKVGPDSGRQNQSEGARPRMQRPQ